MPPHFHGGSQGDRITKAGMKILWGYVWQYRYRFLIGVLGLACIDLAVLLMPHFIALAFDALSDGTATRELLRKLCLTMIAIMTAGIFFRFLWRYCFSGVGLKINRDLRQKIFDHLQTMPPEYFDKHRVGDLTAHMTNDVQAVEHSVAFGMLAGADSLVMGGMIIVLMLQENWKLALLVLVPAPIIMIVVRVIGRQIRVLFGKVQESFSAMNERAQEIFAGIMVVKAYGDEPASLESFGKEGKAYVDNSIALVRKWAMMGPLIMVVSNLCMALLLWFGGKRIIMGEMPLGTFTKFYMYLGTMTWPMIAVSEVINHLERGCASAERIQTIIEEESTIKDGTENVKGETLLEVKDLTYKYPGAIKNALENITCHVAEGETLGIVGRTGCGKTTLVDLCMRLYSPPPGTVFLNGKDISEYKLDELRGVFGYVPQEPFLFSMTIKDNIRFAKPEMDDEEVVYWAKKAFIHDDIMRFNDGYDTWVGERGVTLSGGQKQRIAIARALSLRPRILVLDDALSAVDAETESEILKELGEIRGKSTNIIIAHRLSAVKNADRTIVLDHGKIENIGVHEELKVRSPYYKELFMLQSAVIEDGK